MAEHILSADEQMEYKGERPRVRRVPQRGRYDQQSVHQVLDARFLAHVGFVGAKRPFVIPTLYGREGGTLFLHGSSASRMMKTLSQGIAVCVCVTLVDGMVLARSTFNHSINYRSVVAFGITELLQDASEKLHGLRVISEHLLRGRWDDTRPPNDQELRATSALRLPIQEASAKIRTGPVIDDNADYSLPHWAGIVPLIQRGVDPFRMDISEHRLRRQTTSKLFFSTANPIDG